jgi:hypothetical protein
VRDVRAVEPLALLDERFRPDHLLGRAEVHALVEDVIGHGVVEPVLVDTREAIARAEDDVDEEFAVVGFAEPVRERLLGDVAGRPERGQGRLEVFLADEDVEVLGVALDAGVAREGVGAADQHREARLAEHAQGMAVELARLRVQERSCRRHLPAMRLVQARCGPWRRGSCPRPRP